MANKAFEIQNSTLRIGGVELQAGTTGVVIPGVTQATNYFVEEVDDRDGSNPDTFGTDPEAVMLLDNAAYLFRSGTETPSGSYSEAGYSVQDLDDGEIEKIYVEVEGTFSSADKAFAEAGNMWATTVPGAKDNFNAGDWTQITFRPKIRAGEVENIGGGADTGNFVFDGNTLELSAGDNDDDMYIKSPDDLYLDALNDDVILRAEDDIRLKTGYNFTDDTYDYELRFNDNAQLVFYSSSTGSDHGHILMTTDSGTSQRVLSVVGNEQVHITTDLENAEKTWKFDRDGNLTLPAGGDIKDSTGTSVLGGSGSNLEIVAGEGIAVDTVDGVVTISATSNSSPQYGYFTDLTHQGDNNQVNGNAVVMDSDGNSYISYVYWDDNQSKDFSGVAKYDSTGEQLWAVNIASQNPDAGYLDIRSLELVTVDGDPSLIALGSYYDNSTSKDVAFMYYVNPTSGSVGEPLIDCELVTTNGMSVEDGVAGYDGSNPYAVVVGQTYDQTLSKTLTPLSGSTTDKLFVSWADFAASGVNNNESLYYFDGPNQYGVTMNAIGVSATTAGSTDPVWAGISIIVSVNELGNYIITGVNGWGYLVNSWSNPVTLTVLGSSLGGTDGINDMTFDFNNVVFDNNGSNIQAAVSNIMGMPPVSGGVYCPGWGSYDWSTQIGNALSFNYQLNGQAYVARFGQTASWTKNFGGGDYDEMNSVVIDNSGNVYAAGKSWNGSRGSLVVKYDIDGNQQWAVYIDPADETGNTLMSVDLLSDGNLITVDEDGIVTKLDSSNGDIIWQVKADTDPSWDGDFRGTATPDGDYIITNFEDDNYTQYVMRVSGSDGSSVWNKRITRTDGNDNGEMQADDDGQYIDCNATNLTIAGRSDNLNNNTVGIVYSFPINGENTDGTYGEFVISNESMNWTTKSTNSVAATINNTAISVTVNSTSPTSSSSSVNADITTIGGEPAVEPTVIEWTNPNNNVWRIEYYNGGASVDYNGSDYDACWFHMDNSPSGGGNFRGAIIQYHAFVQGEGTIIGTIHLSNDYTQQSATHTEHLSGNSNLQFVTLWDCNNEQGQLFFKMTNGLSKNVMIQWTSTVFYGQEFID